MEESHLLTANSYTFDRLEYTMASIIKSISYHPEEAVSLAISLVLQKDDKEFRENVRKVADILDRQPPAQKI